MALLTGGNQAQKVVWHRPGTVETCLRILAVYVALYCTSFVLDFYNFPLLKFAYSLGVYYYQCSISEYFIHRFILHNRRGHRQHHMSVQWDCSLARGEHDGVFFNFAGSFLPGILFFVAWNHWTFKCLLQYNTSKLFSCFVGTIYSILYYIAWNVLHPLFHQVLVEKPTELKHLYDPATLPNMKKSSQALNIGSERKFELTDEGKKLEKWLYANPLVHRLFLHHAIHHLLPIDVNFNIVFLGSDWIMGTHCGCLKEDDLKFDEHGLPCDHPRIRTIMAMREKNINLPFGLKFGEKSEATKMQMLFVSVTATVGLKFMDSARTLQERCWKMWYNFLSGEWAPSVNRNWAFLNYAFEPSDQKDKLKAISPDQESDLPYMQLYYNAAAPGKVQWEGKTVLEVGSGRGGGASFLTRKLKPASYTALDYAANQINFCRKAHGEVDALRFVCGDAMALPFEDNFFDIVVNVESSHVYSDFSKFAMEVNRVLKPGGSFCWTDFRADHKWANLESELKAAGFADELEDITNDVVRGLNVSSADREKLINHLFQWRLPGLSMLGEYLRGLVHNFAGSPGSEVYKKFSSRAWLYKAAVFHKQM